MCFHTWSTKSSPLHNMYVTCTHAGGLRHEIWGLWSRYLQVGAGKRAKLCIDLILYHTMQVALILRLL